MVYLLVSLRVYLLAQFFYPQEYKEACDAFLAGLKLDPANAEMERMFR